MQDLSTEKKGYELPMPRMLKTLDLFSTPLPGFNIKGKESVPTFAGGLLSLVIIYISLMFAALKMLHLWSRHNPQVNTFVEKDAFGTEDVFYPAKEGFMLAFTLQDYFSKQSKYDPKYLKWFAKYTIYKPDGTSQAREIPTHICTNEDFDKFFPVADRSAAQLETVKKVPGNEMFCIDWDTADMGFYGLEASGDFSELDIVILPCNVRLSTLGGVEDRIDPECVGSLEEQISYIGPMNMLVYYNTERFIQDEFGDLRTEKSSTFANIQADETKPNWIQMLVKKSSLSDETTYVQWGQQDETEFFNLHFDPPRPSAWTKFPTAENPNTRYKFTSLVVFLDPDLTIIERQTYSVLEWLGDVGGLFDGLKIIGGVIIGPMAEFSLKATLLSQIFRFIKSLAYQQPSFVGVNTPEKLKTNLQWDFENDKFI